MDQRRRPERAPRARLPSGDGGHRNHQRDECIGEQPHAERRRQRIAGPRRPRMARRGRCADRVRRIGDRPLRPADDAGMVALVAQHRLHYDGGKEAERRVAGCDQHRERPLDADLRQLVGRQRTEIPDQAEDGGGEQEGIEPRRRGRAPRADHHRQQHRIEHDARAQADQIQQLAHSRSVTRSRYASTPAHRNRNRSCGRFAPGEWSIAPGDLLPIVGPTVAPLGPRTDRSGIAPSAGPRQTFAGRNHPLMLFRSPPAGRLGRVRAAFKAVSGKEVLCRRGGSLHVLSTALHIMLSLGAIRRGRRTRAGTRRRGDRARHGEGPDRRRDAGGRGQDRESDLRFCADDDHRRVRQVRVQQSGAEPVSRVDRRTGVQDARA